MFGIGPLQLLIVLLVVLLLFGSRLPSVARSLGQSLVEFKKGMKEIDHDSPEDKSGHKD
jgi:sec-independent protein translocase protein TatA